MKRCFSEFIEKTLKFEENSLIFLSAPQRLWSILDCYQEIKNDSQRKETKKIMENDSRRNAWEQSNKFLYRDLSEFSR